MMTSSSLELFENENASDLILIKEIAEAKVKVFYNWHMLRGALLNVIRTIPSELVQSDYTKDSIGKCINRLEHLIETPFTIQRICELILMLDSFKKKSKDCQYSNFEKYLNSLYKCLNVNGKCDDERLTRILVNEIEMDIS